MCYLPAIRDWRACDKNPLPCGPLGERMTISRGIESLEEFNLNREISLSGRSFILITLQADDLPFLCNKFDRF